MFKYVALFFFSLFLLINLVLGAYGISTILLTITVYTLMGIFGFYAITFLAKKSESRNKYFLFWATIVISLFIGELFLKYIFQINLSAQEMKGRPFYFFPYGKPQVERFLRKFGHSEFDWRLNNYTPYSEQMRGSEEFLYQHRYNKLGLRGGDPSIDSGFVNIVGVGDSYTEGKGAPQDSTWLSLLENKLNGDSEERGCAVRCINGGISGSDPFAEYLVLTELLIDFKPSVVMVALNTTDITDIIERGGWERYSDFRAAPWWAYIYQFSFIARAVVQIVHPVDWLFLTKEEEKTERKKAIEKIGQCILNDYLKLSRQQHFKLVVIFHPFREELEQNYYPLQPVAEKLKLVREIETINLFEEFGQLKRDGGSKMEYQSLYWPQDGHHNSKGYQLWAERVSFKIDSILVNLICS